MSFDNNAIAFVGQVIPQKLLNEQFDKLKERVDIAGNTFYTSLLEGFADNGSRVFAESKIDKDTIPQSNEKYGNVEYTYIPYVKNNLARYLSMFFGGGRQIKKFKKYLKSTGKDGYAVFNILRISTSIGALLSCKLRGVKTVGIITDVPGYRIKTKKNGFIKRLADKLGRFILNRMDAYVLLSEAMTEVVDVTKKPYVVVEGIFDTSAEVGENMDAQATSDTFDIVYAGSLHYKYGIMNLVNAVMGLENENIRLHIYGKGEAEEELAAIGERDSRISYHGLISRKELLSIEKSASLLVNPRPTEDEYVKYSFPSKNMEYMASGTPTLLTRISSLPEEYLKYVVLAENNSQQELARCIEMVYSDYEKYILLGESARSFIVKNKNRASQAQRILDKLMSPKDEQK